MEILRIIAPPVIGAVIGYITNDIAIRMLFRPHQAKYILGHRVPFTPGIVPRRKNDLAKTLGDAIVAKFFNADDLEILFTSEGFADAVSGRITALLRSELPIGNLLEGLPEGSEERLEQELCIRVQAAVCTSSLPETLAEEGGKMGVELLGKNAAARAVAETASASMQSKLADAIREYIINEGFGTMMPLIREEAEKLKQTPVSEITRLQTEDDDVLFQSVKKMYMSFMHLYVRPIVESIDVGGQITDKIILMTSEEVEDLVLTVVRKELRLVVLFGGLLGAVIGAVNIFI